MGSTTRPCAGRLKNALKPWLKPQQWCIPPEASAAFVACMEDVLEVYQRPLDPSRPLVCLDEKGLQLVAHTREPLPATPAQPRAKEDFEYARAGAANGFMLYEPLAGQRHALVRERRTGADFAHDLCAPGGSAPGPKAGSPPHPQARLLAEHG